METFTKVPECWKNLIIPHHPVTLNTMGQTLRIILLYEYTLVYVKHFHVCLTLNFLVITDCPEETSRAVLDFNQCFRPVFIITNSVYTPNNLICRTSECTHIIGVKRWIFTHIFVIISRRLLMSRAVIGIQSFTNMVSRRIKFGLLKPRILFELI